MTPLIYFLLSLSVGVPFIIGILNIKKYQAINRVFIYYLGFGLLSEIIFYFSNANLVKIFSYKIFVLLEYLLLAYQYFLWGIPTRKILFFAFLFCGIIIWVLDNIISPTFFGRNSIFSIYSSVYMVISAIDLINKLYFDQNTHSLRKNYKFLVSSSLIIFFTFNIIVECFYIQNLSVSRSFNLSIFNIKAFLSCFINLLFVLVVLWMPTKKTYI